MKPSLGGRSRDADPMLGIIAPTARMTAHGRNRRSLVAKDYALYSGLRRSALRESRRGSDCGDRVSERTATLKRRMRRAIGHAKMGKCGKSPSRGGTIGDDSAVRAGLTAFPVDEFVTQRLRAAPAQGCDLRRWRISLWIESICKQDVAQRDARTRMEHQSGHARWRIVRFVDQQDCTIEL